MPKFRVHATVYTFLAREVEAETSFEAEEMCIGAGDWETEGEDFDIQRSMTQEIIDE